MVFINFSHCKYTAWGWPLIGAVPTSTDPAATAGIRDTLTFAIFPLRDLNGWITVYKCLDKGTGLPKLPYQFCHDMIAGCQLVYRY